MEKEINKLALNELFCAERDVGKISIYDLEVDGKPLGTFRSSGIICSTGTGSSGWL
jgi:NAD kinase